MSTYTGLYRPSSRTRSGSRGYSRSRTPHTEHPVSPQVGNEGTTSVTNLEIVRNISEAWLVVDSSDAGARLGGSPAAQERLSVVFGTTVGRFGGSIGRRRLRIIRHDGLRITRAVGCGGDRAAFSEPSCLPPSTVPNRTTPYTQAFYSHYAVG